MISEAWDQGVLTRAFKGSDTVEDDKKPGCKWGSSVMHCSLFGEKLTLSFEVKNACYFCEKL